MVKIEIVITAESVSEKFGTVWFFFLFTHHHDHLYYFSADNAQPRVRV